MTSTELAGRLQVYFGSDNKMRIATIRDYFRDRDEAWLDALYLAAIEQFEFIPTVAGMRELENRVSVRGRVALPAPEMTDAERKAALKSIHKMVSDLVAQRRWDGKVRVLEEKVATLQADLGHAAEAAEARALEDMNGGTA